ncbi:MAG: 4Fe-4S binding protein [Nitrospirae bacterium]|nr:4Fe-4S binding protein [Nitrospirota bacterium]
MKIVELSPKLGLFLMLCMFGSIGVALYRGRAWCDWMCPRGSFYDLFLTRFSAGRQIPPLFRKGWFRAAVLGLMLSVLGYQVFLAWGDVSAVGLAMVRVLTVTTTVGLALGLIYHQRIWCHICPMGTIGSWMSGGKEPLTIEDSCAGCGVCAKACPMQLSPHSFKGNGVMADNDCIKCSSCVAVCPKRVLNFETGLKKAA